jgi:hypothetical protein
MINTLDAIDPSMLHNLPQVSRSPGDVEIYNDDEESKLESDFGLLQPRRQLFSELFCLGIRSTGDAKLHGLAFASNLPEPQPFTLTVKAKIDVREISAQQLVRFINQNANSKHD